LETTFHSWGYPGLAILLFSSRLPLECSCSINILFYDKSHD
jgi:hypothetical protein